MPENEDQLPDLQIGRAQWLADELALCGHDEITAIDILDALASVGLKLMTDEEGVSSHEVHGRAQVRDSVRQSRPQLMAAFSLKGWAW